MTFLEYLQVDPGRTTDEYAADFAVRRRLGLLDTFVPASDAELVEWLAALELAGQVVCVDGRWEPVFEVREPVGVQGSLFG